MRLIRDLRENEVKKEQADGDDGEECPGDDALAVAAAKGIAFFEKERPEPDPRGQAGKAEDGVSVAAGEAEYRAPRASEEHQCAHGGYHAEDKTDDGCGTPARFEFPRGDGGGQRAEHQPHDFRAQVLDDGRITDSQGRTVDFKNTILIMTSNIGSSYLLDGIEEDGSIKPEAAEMVQNDLRGHFRPEFLNRLDEIIMFKPLTKDNIGGIVDLLMAELNNRLADQEIHIRLTDAAKSYVIEGGYDPVYGARPLKRYLQKYVETLAAKMILGGKVGQDDTIVLDVTDGELTASVQSV